MSENVNNKINKRALVSMFMLFSFLILPVSGIPLHFVRGHNQLTTIEHFLMSIHNASAVIFLISIIFHLFFNWKALKSYITSKTSEMFHFKKEIIISIIIITVIVGLFSSHVLHIH